MMRGKIQMSNDQNMKLTKLQRSCISGKIRRIRQIGADRREVMALIHMLRVQDKYISFIEEVWLEETNDNDR